MTTIVTQGPSVAAGGDYLPAHFSVPSRGVSQQDDKKISKKLRRPIERQNKITSQDLNVYLFNG